MTDETPLERMRREEASGLAGTHTHATAGRKPVHKAKRYKITFADGQTVVLSALSSDDARRKARGFLRHSYPGPQDPPPKVTSTSRG